MIVKSLAVKNYRTLEDIKINFNGFYTAICGKNNSGKSNIFRVIRHILQDNDEYFFNGSSTSINHKKDFSIWKKDAIDKEDIYIKIVLALDSELDNRITRFITEIILKKEERLPTNDKDELIIEFSYKPEQRKKEIQITYNNQEITDNYQKEEILRKIESSNCLIFHNSTEILPRWASARGFDNFLENFSEDEREAINKKKENFLNSLQIPLKKHQKELTELLGRLEEQYDVGLTFSSNRVENLPLEISLNEKGVSSRLEDWGSGTKNRTMIFMHLMNARKLSLSSENSNKIAPIFLIEEPECFLHPSAQAEFGRILQDLANEFKIQVLVTTHSPYLLSYKNTESNLLLEREVEGKNKIKETILIDTKTDKWYEPFVLALGINGDELLPFKKTFFSSANEIILVEGDIDKEYLDLLKNPEHGKNKLDFKGEIFSYGGAGNLQNNILTQFIKERFSKFLITVDYDKINTLKKCFDGIGLIENKNYLAVGYDEIGKDAIEALLPIIIKKKVYEENPEIVEKATSSSKEAKDYKQKLKKLYLEKFKKEATPTEEYYGELYKLAKKINKIFK